jgi:hypothetical protein
MTEYDRTTGNDARKGTDMKPTRQNIKNLVADLEAQILRLEGEEYSVHKLLNWNPSNKELQEKFVDIQDGIEMFKAQRDHWQSQLG